MVLRLRVLNGVNSFHSIPPPNQVVMRRQFKTFSRFYLPTGIPTNPDFAMCRNLEFVFALLITLIQQEQNFWLEFFSYIVNIVLQYGIRSISVSFQ